MRSTTWRAAGCPAKNPFCSGSTPLDSALLQGGGEQSLHDAAATLEIFVATGGVVSNFVDARARYALMAEAVRRAMTDD